ncbi:MAG: AI-2E family transporter [Ignavibacteriales bacterium]|nr:AI-2E family transporter [Ignavibacteriales bacterium]
MATRTSRKAPKTTVSPMALRDGAQGISLILLGIIAVFVVGVILLELKSVLLPFVIAVFLSIIFSPTVAGLKRKGIPTALSLLFVLLALSLVLFLIALVFTSSIDSFVNEVPKYERKLKTIIDGVVHAVNEVAIEYDIDLEQIGWSQAFQFSSVASALTSGVGSFLNLLTNLFLIVLFMLFILSGSGDLASKIRLAFPPHQAERMGGMIRNIETRVRQYLMTKTVISAGTALLTFLILWATGVDFPLVWAFLTFLLNFIPNIGSIIAVIFPVALAFLQFDTAGQPLLVLILLSVTQMAMGNVIEPKLMAFRLNLSAVMILVSLIFWGWLWGVLGMILSVPIMATVKIVLEHVEPLRPYAVLMGGPAEQR